MKKNIVIGAVCLIIGLAAGWLWNLPVQKTGGLNIGTRSIEDFLPGIRENRGIFTALNFFVSNASSTFAGPVNITGTSTAVNALQVSGTSTHSALGVGTTTPAFDFGVHSLVGTTTLGIGTVSTGKGSCIQLRSTDGTNIRIYATTTPAAGNGISNVNFSVSSRGLVIEAGSCE